MHASVVVQAVLFTVSIPLCGCRQPAPQGAAPAPRDPAPAPPAENAARDPEPERTPPPSPAGPVVGHVRTRDATVTIRAGADGPLYTVRSPEGEILVAGVTGEELAARFPGLGEVVEHGVADWAGIDREWQDVHDFPQGTPRVQTRTETVTFGDVQGNGLSR
jgi:hypothetical protein